MVNARELGRWAAVIREWAEPYARGSEMRVEMNLVAHSIEAAAEEMKAEETKMHPDLDAWEEKLGRSMRRLDEIAAQIEEKKRAPSATPDQLRKWAEEILHMARTEHLDWRCKELTEIHNEMLGAANKSDLASVTVYAPSGQCITCPYGVTKKPELEHIVLNAESVTVNCDVPAWAKLDREKEAARRKDWAGRLRRLADLWVVNTPVRLSLRDMADEMEGKDA